MEPFIGQIIMFGGNFAPRGWAFCEGQLLPIQNHTALFSILGTIYGGDGRTTFGLPDLRGRVPIHPGQGQGLTEKRLGAKGGQEQVALTAAQVPAHKHKGTGTILVDDTKADDSNPKGNVLSVLSKGAKAYSSNPNTTMKNDCVKFDTDSVGGSQAHQNMQPFQAVNFIIALEGIFPSRS